MREQHSCLQCVFGYPIRQQHSREVFKQHQYLCELFIISYCMATSRSPRQPRSISAVLQQEQHHWHVQDGINVCSSREYDRHVREVRDEQERVQKKVFTNWINHYLAQHAPPYRIEKLLNDLRDGTKLLALLEVLSGERLIEENTRLLADQLSQIPSSSTSSIDSVGQVPCGEVLMHGVTPGTPLGKPSPLDRWKGGARKALLQWVKNSISQRFGIQVSDFGPSWRDGMAFLAIIDKIRPGLINMDTARQMSNRDRLNMAFNIAESVLGIARLLDAEDIDVDHPDEKSLMTYVSQFLHKYPETYAQPEQELMAVPPSPVQQDDATTLSRWLDHAETVLMILNKPVTNHFEEYKQYKAFQNDMETKRTLYNQLSNKITKKTADPVLVSMWPVLDQRWKQLETNMARWRWKLDCSLPGRLGQLGEWLNQAEQRLTGDVLPHGKHEEMPNLVAMKLNEYKIFFQDLQGVQQVFRQLQYSPEVGSVPPDHMQDLNQRLDRVSVLAHQHRSLLLFEEQKYKILEFVSTVEKKLREWDIKYGYHPEVEELLNVYKDFVEKRNIFQEFEQSYAVLQNAAETCQRTGTAVLPGKAPSGGTMIIINDEFVKSTIALFFLNFQVQGEIEDYDSLYKNISKKAQGLIRVLSPPEVEIMMSNLKQEKELLLTIRTRIASCLHILCQVLTNQEALESGIKELTGWIEEAEKVIAGYVIPTTPEQISLQLEKHKAFFKRFPYYKSVFESKNKLYQNLLKEASGAPEINVAGIKHTMTDLNDRFEQCISLSEQWEQAMTEATNRWQRYFETVMVIEEWLEKARRLLTDTTVKWEKLETQQEFFEKPVQHMMRKLVSASESVMATLPETEQKPLQETVENLQGQWKNIWQQVPTHLVQLEFQLLEQDFEFQLQEAEKELKIEQERFDSGEKTEKVLQGHWEFFQSGPTSHRIQGLLSKMEILSGQEEGNKLQAECEHHRKQWEILEQRIQAMHDQLQRNQEEWRDYCLRFNSIIRWMDEMEKNIAATTQEMASSQEFETVKVKFQEMCKDVDTHEEDVKWLVQKLENLVLKLPDTEAVQEKNRLDALVDRYKNLVPIIETTVIYTETISKCYIFREEVQEVTCWLKGVQEETEAKDEGAFENVEKLEEMLAQQKALVGELEKQQPAILASVSKGKELKNVPSVPSFVEREVFNLETSWKEVYEKALDKLNTLKKAQKMWTDYNEQKSEIFRLLHQAQEDLRRMTTPAYPRTIEEELKVKQKMSIQLREATEAMLERLRSLGKDLVQHVTTQRQPLFEKEVVEIEKQIRVILQTMTEKVVYLEQTTQKWITFTAKLEEISNWIEQAQNMLDRISLEDLPLADSTRHAQQILSEITQQTEVLRNLERESQELANEQPDSENVKELNAQLADLRQKLQKLEETTKVTLENLSRNLEAVEEYKRFISKENEEIKLAETRISEGFVRPVSLEDARVKKQSTEQFQEQCLEKIAQLSDVAVQTQKDQVDTAVQTELDFLQSQWQTVFDTVKTWAERLERTLHSWESLSIKTEDLISWVVETEEHVKKPLKTNTVIIEKLEGLKEDLKHLSIEVFEKQQSLSEIFKEVEELSQNISQKATTALRAHLSDIRHRINNLSDYVHQLQAQVASVIAERKDLLRKIKTFQEWIDETQLILKDQQDVFFSHVDQMLKQTRIMKEESSRKQELFNDIYATVRQLSETCMPEEVEQVQSAYSSLSENYQWLEDLLDVRVDFLQKLENFHLWQRDLREHLSLLEQKLNSHQLVEEEMSSIASELEIIKTQLETKECESSELDNLITKAQLKLFKDSSNMSSTLSLYNLLTELKDRHSKVTEMLRKRQQKTTFLHQQHQDFNETLEKLVAWIKDTDSKIQNLRPRSDTQSGIVALQNDIKELTEDLTSHKADYTKVLEKGRALIEVNPSELSDIQTKLTSLDTFWEQLSSELARKEKLFNQVLALWKECDDLYKQMLNVIQEAMQKAAPPEHPPCDSIQSLSMLEKAKTANELMKSHRSVTDNYSHKMKEMKDKLTSVEGFNVEFLQTELEEAQQQWRTAWERIMQRLQTCESQLVLWQQIDSVKEQLMTWLTETCSAFNSFLENFSGHEKAQSLLNKYKNEVGFYETTHAGLCAKISALEKLTDNQEIATLTSLKSVLQAQFDEARDVANKLESVLRNIENEQGTVEEEMQAFSDYLKKQRESVSRCDNSSGSDELVLQRLEQCKKLGEEMNTYYKKLEQIETNIHTLQQNHSSLDTSGLQKELSNLQKRYETVKNQAAKVNSNLFSVLERHYQSGLQEFQRWLTAYSEKVSWCDPDLAGDRFSLEAQMGTLRVYLDLNSYFVTVLILS
ncbi:nesprin-1-like [Limulus polyphemus]|uniref:Nesprin-1-like n=1 Tax=Limulus polyphemus TaxID=6850 RepID=A0ABM1TGR4_LIMPO|nr:nesprin-1-like [Limulus polyphemus]